ncbi:MAG: DUF58 domain-containing protein [Armatimonadetes bacterium]|nr:DUF58 domain-containing protein [Armatimonadota bacterium]
MRQFFSKILAFAASLLPSPRLAAWVMLGAALWVAAALVPSWRVLVALYDVILIVLAIVDAVLSPRPRDFDLEREFEPKMNLGAPNEITLRVRNRARLPVSLTLRDEVPESWTVSTAEPARESNGVVLPVLPKISLRVEAGKEVETRYQVSPSRRGDFRFGALHARYATILGLWFRQFQIDPPNAEARVYPDISAVRRFELALREGKMRDIGLHLLRLRGRGTEFESLREYSTGDEYKSINWKASARRGKLISTNYEIERDQTIVICLDCGRMMTSLAVSRDEKREASEDDGILDSRLAPSETPLSKLDCAINATVLLSHVAASMGDSVGLLLFSDGVLKWLPPRKGKIQTGAIIEALYGAQPALVEADYQVAYEHLMARRVRRALVVTFTDIIDADASRELFNASGALRRHHNALCVTINNRDVIDMAEKFPENDGQFYEKALAQRMLSQREGALERLRASGVGILDVEANQLTIATVNRYLNLKSRGAL